MFYRASDSKLSTRDWLRLSVDTIPQSLISAALKASEDEDDLQEIEGAIPVPEWDREPSSLGEEHGIEVFREPDSTDYDGGEEDPGYTADCARWKRYNDAAREEIESRETRDRLPMWSTMWSVSDGDDERVREAALASGFRVYDASRIDLDLVLGIEGCGYGFFGAHWIPLRARIALSQCEHEGRTGADLKRHQREVRALVAMLRAESQAEGDYNSATIDPLLVAAGIVE